MRSWPAWRAHEDGGALEFEVIVVDNGPRRRRRIRERFPQVRLVDNGGTLARPRREPGIRLARGVRPLLNPDTVVHDGALAAMVAT
jgi:GT2 family glycosyltransferase